LRWSFRYFIQSENTSIADILLPISSSNINFLLRCCRKTNTICFILNIVHHVTIKYGNLNNITVYFKPNESQHCRSICIHIIFFIYGIIKFDDHKFKCKVLRSKFLLTRSNITQIHYFLYFNILPKLSFFEYNIDLIWLSRTQTMKTRLYGVQYVLRSYMFCDWYCYCVFTVCLPHLQNIIYIYIIMQPPPHPTHPPKNNY
jgi:hypothetical protein